MVNVAIIGAYLVGMLIIGFVSFGKIRNIASFYVGDRAGTTVLVSGSLLATIVGGSSTLGIAGLGFSRGLVGAWWMLVGALGLLVLSFWFSEKVRSYEVYTLPEILKSQYGSDVIKVIASLLISLAWIGVIAAQVIAGGKILTTLWPIDLEISMVLIATVCVLYTVLGGQYSILKTDFIQFIIIISGIIICLASSVVNTGGVPIMMEKLPHGHASFPVSETFRVHDLLLFCLFVGSTFIVGPDIYSRLFCAQTPRIARRASLITAFIMIPLAFAVTLIGMAARVLLPEILPESAFPALIMHLLPVGLNALVIAALLAAVMSSADTCLLTTSTILMADVLQPVFRDGIQEKKLILLSRTGVLVIGVISLVIALKAGGIISSLLLAYTIYSGGLVVPVIFGFYARPLRLHHVGAILSVISGGCLALFLKLTSHDDLLLLCFPVGAVVLLAGSVFGRYIDKRESTSP
ncbi:MAG: sodium:solute symporter family protein [Desulfomonilia bacterium]